MHVTLVHVRVRPESITDFVEACRLNHLGSVAEPGNRRFDILQDAADPTHFVLYEAYASAADAKAHKETAHYHTWRETVADMMAAPREGQPFSGLFPVV
ncbi:MAG: antibiotic biosynthesis monooxygenase [Gammaproteobacteria bacterium]|nr:antibiotic biosynthesis monooxygenase [Gammaproteobacteria bacterium]MCP5298963.1 antibiotic biosynthesis monooxygenase [Chromatiaceae bacterium]